MVICLFLTNKELKIKNWEINLFHRRYLCAVYRFTIVFLLFMQGQTEAHEAP